MKIVYMKIISIILLCGYLVYMKIIIVIESNCELQYVLKLMKLLFNVVFFLDDFNFFIYSK